MFQIHIESGGIFYGKDRCTPKKNTSWNGERKKTVVYSNIIVGADIIRP